MTLDEAIKWEEEVAEENRNIDERELDLLYCGDTECIETHKSSCIACAKEHEQLAEWLKDYKRLKGQESKTEQFAKWVATEIFDDMWEYNTDAFAEIACRKLAKLGIVRANGGEWELVESQKSEVEE